MTETIQYRSLAIFSEPDKNLSIQKPGTEDDMDNLLLLLDGLNELSKNLCILIDSAQKYNNLRVAELPYLQEIKRLTRFLQDEEKGEKK